MDGEPFVRRKSNRTYLDDRAALRSSRRSWIALIAVYCVVLAAAFWAFTVLAGEVAP